MQVEPRAHRGGGLCSTSHTDVVSEQSAPFHPSGHWQLQTDTVRHCEKLGNTHFQCGIIINNPNKTYPPLTRQMSQSLRMSLHSCSEHEHRVWHHTDPHCAQKLDAPQAAPVFGTFRLFSCETALQKCTLWQQTDTVMSKNVRIKTQIY